MIEYAAKLGEYFLTKKLGAGQFSKVRLGEKDGKKYAVKYMLQTNDFLKNKTCLDLVFNEAKIMLQLDHPNIVKLYDFNEKGIISKANGKEVPVLYLVFELITGGEIFDYIAVGGRFSDRLARHYFKQLIGALEYLYSKGYAHRDIKAENILLDGDYNLKLADFGFATLMQGKDGTGKLHSMKGTLGYMAPELNAGQVYSGEKVDLFAVGVLLFTMLAQHPPFRKAVITDPFYKLFCQQNDLFWVKMGTNKPSGVFSAEFKLLINRLLAYDPAKRPTIAEIKASPWCVGTEMTPEEIKIDLEGRKRKVDAEAKAKIKEVSAKKKEKRDMELKKIAATGGLAPHLAVKGGMSVDMTAKSAAARFLAIYKPEVFESTNLLSMEDPEAILSGLMKVLDQNNAKIQLHKTKYKIQTAFADLEVGDTAMDIRIEKVDDDVNCVRFQRTFGNKLEYLRLYTLIKDALIEQNIIL